MAKTGSMEPLLFGLAESFVRYLDDRFGRAAAWIASTIAIGGFIASPFAVAWYLFG